jgi:hypothetical protein
MAQKECRNSGSNQGPLDLQSNALPTELFRLLILFSRLSKVTFDQVIIDLIKKIDYKTYNHTIL